EVNLKLIWDVISAIKVGKTGIAFVLDRQGRLIAHPDISLVLRGAEEATSKPFRTIRDAIGPGAGFALSRDAYGRDVAASAAPVAGSPLSGGGGGTPSGAFAPPPAGFWAAAHAFPPHTPFLRGFSPCIPRPRHGARINARR